MAGSLLILVFVIGYAAIALEHITRINKSAVALITGVICWAVYIISEPGISHVNKELTRHLGEMSGILFFLLSAMTIVELIDSHDGFSIITDRLTVKRKRLLVLIISFVTFFMSAVLDNLTTAIVVMSFLRKLVRDKDERLYLTGLVIIAANAGGAWSPIGDVTTTMLWIGGQVTAFNIILKLFLPGLICMIVPMIIVMARIKGNVEKVEKTDRKTEQVSGKHQLIVLISGSLALISVPVIKTITGLPPYMAILFSLGIIWILNEALHGSLDKAERSRLSVVHALRKIDVPTILFFLGILLAVSALQSAGVLLKFAAMIRSIGNETRMAMVTGLFSSVVDNVPLVSAVQGMFSLSQYPPDHYFWEFLAFTSGTGGSALVIGSAAGVAAMGIEKINFVWYLKKISWLALLGYFSGSLFYVFQSSI